ncbi:hypothetical protein G9272_43580 [Streptomyces asoensis]|uniref:Uncharacterized protein n=1 Tax=Streptomyces asoensis TaxID=249586 RepID=A0A6M4X3W0_9ACTN|nr:hypothetical protein [Streptomyces asoensis]QJT06345.1 hypothetical protein G9272_43580 [Streptomyces asoensis]
MRFSKIRYEWQSAVVLWDRLSAARDLADLRATEGPPFRYYEQAIHEIAGDVDDYERKTGLTTWRYAASATVLGVTVLERIARAKPPLTATAVEELCQEPTLGRLREALSVSAADFLPARERSPLDERKEMAQRWAELRDGVDSALESIVEIAEDKGAAHPRTEEEAAGSLDDRAQPTPHRSGVPGNPGTAARSGRGGPVRDQPGHQGPLTPTDRIGSPESRGPA